MVRLDEVIVLIAVLREGERFRQRTVNTEVLVRGGHRRRRVGRLAVNLRGVRLTDRDRMSAKALKSEDRLL